MKFALASYGTRGDIEPCGHPVREDRATVDASEAAQAGARARSVKMAKPGVISSTSDMEASSQAVAGGSIASTSGSFEVPTSVGGVSWT